MNRYLMIVRPWDASGGSSVHDEALYIKAETAREDLLKLYEKKDYDWEKWRVIDWEVRLASQPQEAPGVDALERVPKWLDSARQRMQVLMTTGGNIGGKSGKLIEREIKKLDDLLTEAAKLNRWQAESLKAFRDEFGVPSNCQAIDAIHELKRATPTGRATEELRVRVRNVAEALRLFSASDSLGASEKMSIFSASQELRAALAKGGGE